MSLARLPQSLRSYNEIYSLWREVNSDLWRSHWGWTWICSCFSPPVGHMTYYYGKRVPAAELGRHQQARLALAALVASWGATCVAPVLWQLIGTHFTHHLSLFLCVCPRCLFYRRLSCLSLAYKPARLAAKCCANMQCSFVGLVNYLSLLNKSQKLLSLTLHLIGNIISMFQLAGKPPVLDLNRVIMGKIVHLLN